MKKLTVQFASDIHLEFTSNVNYLKANPLKPKGRILILAGDITYFDERHFRSDFFDYCNDNWEQTFMVPGNHEYYNRREVTKSGVIPSGKVAIRDNVFVVNQQHENIEGVHFLFTTLWTHLRPQNAWNVSNGLNDFRCIVRNGAVINAESYNEMHQMDKSWLEEELRKLTFEDNLRLVVTTHHLPTTAVIQERFRGDSLNDGFAVELSELILDNRVNYWIYGHSHGTEETTIGSTKIITNQLGYVSEMEAGKFSLENDRFDNSRTITL